MKKQLIGYILSAIGLIGLALSSKLGEKILPQNIPSEYILIPSVTITAVGIIILLLTSKKGIGKNKELPIYKGKEVVGYRVKE